MTFPYDGLPPERTWREAVAGRAPGEVDPQVPGRFRIGRTTRVGSGGSCFARRLSERLRRAGFAYLDVEPALPWLSAEDRAAWNYGVYSARYGDVFTSLQLLQMLERALGLRASTEDAWEAPGGFVDPYRPLVQPDPFGSVEELRSARESHLAAVRRLFETVEVFVFTLGLTEAWTAADGTALPLCPGKRFGTFDPERYRFRNLTVAENVAALESFLALLARINPGARVLLTVSPVPLVATMEDRHVLASTTYSKSVLRVAAEEVRQRHANVDYFASYEIVTATGNPHYFAEDRRSVTEAAVDHVLRSFFAHFVDGSDPPAPTVEAAPAPLELVPCDEEKLLAALEEDADR